MGLLVLLAAGYLAWDYFNKKSMGGTSLPAPVMASPVSTLFGDTITPPRPIAPPRIAPTVTLETGQVVATGLRSTAVPVVPAGNVRTGGGGAPVSTVLIQNAGVRLTHGLEFGPPGNRWKILHVGLGEFVNREVAGMGPFPLGTELWSFQAKRVFTLTDQGTGPAARYVFVVA